MTSSVDICLFPIYGKQWPNVPNHQPDNHWMIVLCMQHVFLIQWWIQHFFLLRMDDWSLSMFIQHIGEKTLKIGVFHQQTSFFSPVHPTKNRDTDKHGGWSTNTISPSKVSKFPALGPATKKQSKSWWTCSIRDKLWDVHVLKTQTATIETSSSPKSS